MNRLSILALTLVSFYSCNHIENQKDNPIRPGVVTITGQIEDYSGSFGTSLLAYTEPVTGLHKTEVVEIDSAGSFITSFQIAHATHKVTLVMEKSAISIFVEPDRSYNISISNEGEFSFLGEGGEVNNQILELEAALKLKFHDDEEIRMLYKRSDTTKYVECREFIVDLSRRRMEFVKRYCDSNLICDEAIDCKYRVKIAQVHRVKTAQLRDVKVPPSFDLFKLFFTGEGRMRPEAESDLPR